MTNKIVLRSVDEFMAGYTPVYNPILPLFVGRSKQYSQEFGTVKNRTLQTVGDIRNKQFTPKDTEIKQIAVREGSKVFKKVFYGSQFVQSSFQDLQGAEDMIAQVLDEQFKQSDEELLGTSLNSGLYTSTDENYLLESSHEVDKDGSNGHLDDLYATIVAEKNKADKVSGQKLVMLYGSTLMPKYNSLFTSVAKPFRAVLAEAMPGTPIVDMPSDITPNNANGFIVINMDQILLHWTTFPVLKNQGLDERRNEYWFNFLSGSMMVDCKVKNAIIRQPLTLEA